MIARRAIAPTDLHPSMQREPAGIRPRCKCTIRLDGHTYRCGRSHAAGIHDAFQTHHDGGAVRW